MGDEESKARPPVGNLKTFSRSSSWTDRSPRKPSNSKPKWNSKVRACLPPLQPLSISKPCFEDWPSPGSDDVGVWLASPAPGVRPRFLTPRESSSSELTRREIEHPRDKMAFFKKECSKIVDYIYLGSNTVAKNREVLLQNGITHVLNCVGFVCPEYFKNDFVYKTLWLHDRPSEDITSILYDVFDYFEDVREQGGQVFVHCCEGVSRSNSLVIAYLMWKEGQSFEDAFQHVKTARGVTNPNMGFACQLLQCQKRMHALPASPSSVLRMYRMAPHSQYDPLHLVPKRLNEPGRHGLDSRGAFIIHVPLAIYVWVGKHCISVIEDNAIAAAFQVIRYEKAQGPAIIIREGEETSEFWEALGNDIAALDSCSHQRKVDDYDSDFGIFHKAFSGGVVPPFPLSGNGSVTCLPARETGWSRLRRKFASGVMKKFITSAKLSCTAAETCHDLEMTDACKGVESFLSPVEPSSPSIAHCDSPGSFATSSLSQMKDSSKVVENVVTFSDPSVTSKPSLISLETIRKPPFCYVSPALSPATSEYSSSFTFSPSSSNWSDLSYLSTHPSPTELGPRDLYPLKSASEDCARLHNKGNSSSHEEEFSASYTLRMFNACSQTSPSLAERRGNIISPEMMLTTVDVAEVPEVPANLVRSCSFSLSGSEDEIMKDIECNKPREGSCEMTKVESTLHSDIFNGDSGSLRRIQDENKYDIYHTLSHDIPEKVAELAKLVIYKWPSMRKVDMHDDAPDSSSIYIIYVSNEGTYNTDVLFIWVGHDVTWKGSHDQLMSIDSNSKDAHDWLKTVGHHFLSQRSLATDCPIQIVKEGNEPEQLLKHLPCFSFQKT